MTSMNIKLGDIGYRLKGQELERESMAKLLPRLEREYGMGRLKAVIADYLYMSEVRVHHIWGARFIEDMDEALEEGRITEEEADVLEMADIVAWGRRRVEGTKLWFAVQAATIIDNSDVERAAAGAVALRKVSGDDAVGVVYGRRIAGQQRVRAEDLGVAVMLDEEGEQG